MHTCPNLHDFPSVLCEQLRSVDPSQPTNFGPGSQQKQLLLAMRYAAGLPLWIDGDTNWVLEPEPERSEFIFDQDDIENDHFADLD